MPINQFQDIYAKKGEQFIKDLLNLKVKISEKMAGSHFSFEYKDNNFTFYKRDISTPINHIDRLISTYYELAIKYIESLPDEIKKQLPDNYRFYFDYFPNQKPNYIEYRRVPKNHLLLTHILVKPNENNLEKNDGESIIADKERLDKWAEILNVEHSPIIFEGHLSDLQKDKLMDFIRMPKDEIQKKFKTTSFVAFLLGILNPNIKHSTLQNNLDDHIEGIIIAFGDNKYQVLAKIIDPFFDEIISQNSTRKEGRSDIIPIIFSDIIEFMEQENKWESMHLRKLDVENRYIELISRMFNVFIDNFGNRYEKITILLPSYLKRAEFDLNRDLIENSKTLEYINKSPSFREIFKMFLILFRKKKKKVQEFLSPHVIKFQNDIVDKIYNRITNIDENDIQLFEKYNSEFSEENDEQIYENYSIPDIPEYLIQKESINEGAQENMNVMKLLSFWQNVLNYNKSGSKKITGKPVNIVIGKFQPFNIGHLEACKEIYEKNKKPIVIFQVHNEIKGDSRPFSKTLTEKLLNKIIDNYDIFEAFHIIKNSNSDSINKKIEGKYRPVSIGGNENYIRHFRNDMRDQINEPGEENNIEFYELKKYINEDKHILNKEIVDMIRNNDYLSFKQHMPKCLHGYFEEMRQELK